MHENRLTKSVRILIGTILLANITSIVLYWIARFSPDVTFSEPVLTVVVLCVSFGSMALVWIITWHVWRRYEHHPASEETRVKVFTGDLVQHPTPKLLRFSLTPA